MEDSLEKITINIDSYNATFIDDYEFYVDIIDDIKNCIYIKTLKTEVITDHYKNNSMFRPFEYIYISLNDIHRINTVSKEIVPKKFKDLIDNESGYGFNGTSNYIRYTKRTGVYEYEAGELTEAVIGNSNVYNSDQGDYIYDNVVLKQFKDLNDGESGYDFDGTSNYIKYTKNDGVYEYDGGRVDEAEIGNNHIYNSDQGEYNVVLKKFKDLIDGESGYGYNAGSDSYIKYTKNGGVYEYEAGELTEAVIGNSNVYIEDPTSNIFNDKTNYEIKDIYKIKDIYYNTLRYFDNIYINYEANPPADGIKVYKQELTGTSCGPNDTNTKVLNPILPELRRFNIILWRVDELGKHVKVPIGHDKHVLRVIMSFTIYYKRKKITRV